MAIDHLLPRLSQRSYVNTASNSSTKLFKVDSRLGRIQGMKKHALLKWRELVDIFDVLLFQVHFSNDLSRVWLSFVRRLSKSCCRTRACGKSEGVYPPLSTVWQ